MEKLKSVASTEENPKWAEMISRENDLYKNDDDIRTEFERDYTRIIYSKAFKRLKHKTQVFFSPSNDHVCTRIEHVNNVESISYTIAKALGLNTELTKTIAMAHDLGHSPFGHQGERILNKILLKKTGKTFWHEKNGLNCVDNIELLEDRDGFLQNLNLTYAVRDGIISHCGEIDENGIKPRKNRINLDEYTKPNEYAPYTWEGCVVKVADKISYIGRDMEDAVRFDILNKEEIDELNTILKIDNCGLKTINNTNIINKLIIDLVNNSSIENGLSFSEESFELINKLKKFDAEKIYTNERVLKANSYFELIINTIFDVLDSVYCDKIEKILKHENYKLYKDTINEFVEWLSNYVLENNFVEPTENNLKNRKAYDICKKEDYALAVCEYISGMTDNKAIDVFNKIIKF